MDTITGRAPPSHEPTYNTPTRLKSWHESEEHRIASSYQQATNRGTKKENGMRGAQRRENAKEVITIKSKPKSSIPRFGAAASSAVGVGKCVSMKFPCRHRTTEDRRKKRGKGTVGLVGRAKGRRV